MSAGCGLVQVELAIFTAVKCGRHEVGMMDDMVVAMQALCEAFVGFALKC
jgi:hypothetical protein